jgi:hypothetical protein
MYKRGRIHVTCRAAYISDNLSRSCCFLFIFKASSFIVGLAHPSRAPERILMERSFRFYLEVADSSQNDSQ